MVNAAHRWTGAGRLPWLAAAFLAVGLAGLPLNADAAGETKKAGKSAKAAKEKSDGDAQRDPAATQRAYAAGLKAFEAGDMAGTEQNLSAALASGGLPNAQMARALYYRGTAYRKQGRPAQAISDLTTAVWLKGGLPEDLKKKATEERQLAYREAGLGDNPPTIGAAPLDQGTASAPGAKSGAQVVNASQPSSFWNFLPTLPSLTGSSQTAQTQPAAAPTALPGTVAQAPAAPQASAFGPASDGTPAVAQSSSWETQTDAAAVQAAAPPQQVAAATGYAPAPETNGINPMGSAPAASSPGGTVSNPLAGAGSAVSGFFGNIFGSGTSSSQAASTEAPTAVTTGSTAQTLGWGQETTVSTAQTSSMVQRGPESPTELPWAGPQTAAAPPPVAAKTKTASAGPAGGAYKLQVAAVRSRDEAERLARSLDAYPGVQSGAVSSEIDEAVIGSMGTFYRVRLGPYADAKEPTQLCKTLRPQGFDCLVVTQ